MGNPYQNILDTLSDSIVRAHHIRKGYMSEDATGQETALEIYEKMRLYRNGLDQLELILNACIRLKAKVDVIKATKAGEVEDAEIKIVDTSAKAEKFQVARDRNIDINAKTIAERKALRQITEVAVEAQAAVDVVRNMHRGLDSAKRDLEVALRAITVITSLER